MSDDELGAARSLADCCERAGAFCGNGLVAIVERQAAALAEAHRTLEALGDWAFTIHGGTKSPADVWPGVRDLLAPYRPGGAPSPAATETGDGR